MAFTNEVVLVGGGVLLGLGLATYFIGRRNPVWAAAFLAFCLVVFIILNYI
jgi:hypothetical protein